MGFQVYLQYLHKREKGIAMLIATGLMSTEWYHYTGNIQALSDRIRSDICDVFLFLVVVAKFRTSLSLISLILHILSYLMHCLYIILLKGLSHPMFILA